MGLFLENNNRKDNKKQGFTLLEVVICAGSLCHRNIGGCADAVYGGKEFYHRRCGYSR